MVISLSNTCKLYLKINSLSRHFTATLQPRKVACFVQPYAPLLNFFSSRLISFLLTIQVCCCYNVLCYWFCCSWWICCCCCWSSLWLSCLSRWKFCNSVSFSWILCVHSLVEMLSSNICCFCALMRCNSLFSSLICWCSDKSWFYDRAFCV